MGNYFQELCNFWPGTPQQHSSIFEPQVTHFLEHLDLDDPIELVLPCSMQHSFSENIITSKRNINSDIKKFYSKKLDIPYYNENSYMLSVRERVNMNWVLYFKENKVSNFMSDNIFIENLELEEENKYYITLGN